MSEAERIKNLEELVTLQEHLLACYRTGGRPSGTKLDRITRLKRELGLR